MPDFISEIKGLIDDLKNKYEIVEINPATWNSPAPAGGGSTNCKKGNNLC